MQFYRNFAKALEDFREGGGAMLVLAPAAYGEHCTWQVGEFHEIAEATDQAPKDATRRALVAGGLCDDEVDAEMAEWSD